MVPTLSRYFVTNWYISLHFCAARIDAPGREAMAAPAGHRTNATQVGSSLKDTDIERLRQRLQDTINTSAVRYRDIERSTGLPGYQVRNFVNCTTKSHHCTF
jgi:hypothetical protein